MKITNIVLNFMMIGGIVSIVFGQYCVSITIAKFHFGNHVFLTNNQIDLLAYTVSWKEVRFCEWRNSFDF